MFHPQFYLLVSGIFLFLVVLSEQFYFKLFFIWCALSFLAVSIAYLLNNPNIFRKRQSGLIPIYIRWLFIPFLLATQLYNSFARKNDPVPALQKIDDNLYLARRLFPSDVEDLKHHNITAVLDVTAEFNALDISLLGEGIDYLNLPILDHSVPSLSQVTKALHWLQTHQKADNAVVIHCALGRGRSVFMMAAYLLSRNPQMSVTETLEKIQTIRQTARLNKKQFKRLTRYHRSKQLIIKNAAWLIANPVSGGQKWQKNKDDILAQLSDYFELTIKETSKEVSGTEFAKQAVEQGVQTVIACGGDGTVTQVASALINTDTQLGIIPLGTTNALSHVLWGISSKIIPIESACLNIIEGYSEKIDTADCNGELMLLLAGVGFEQKMIEEASREAKNAHGQFAYLQGLWRAISQNEAVHLNIKIDDEPEQEIVINSITIANASPVTTLLAQGKGAPNIQDGKLDITWIPHTNSSSEPIINLFELALSGLTNERFNEDIKHTYASKVEIRLANAGSSLKYVIDGEESQTEKLVVKVNPLSLNVLVPEKISTEE
ncbi:diacylglycerol kinase family protein [Catenovulum sp. 2E275]|uniref:diacylglycerol kinase family protein n=1 Tax=Catenovulum sp. 2E275 TaxID=2980497 RepID=UPI0021D063CD|nr:diacylglycerol kinase family protein [Catenovulum sp. 2E275]MCU4676619.1 diacylglycerol kinase family protein [Catenovulum sp. 2E275]